MWSAWGAPGSPPVQESPSRGGSRVIVPLRGASRFRFPLLPPPLSFSKIITDEGAWGAFLALPVSQAQRRVPGLPFPRVRDVSQRATPQPAVAGKRRGSHLAAGVCLCVFVRFLVLRPFLLFFFGSDWVPIRGGHSCQRRKSSFSRDKDSVLRPVFLCPALNP